MDHIINKHGGRDFWIFLSFPCNILICLVIHIRIISKDSQSSWRSTILSIYVVRENPGRSNHLKRQCRKKSKKKLFSIIFWSSINARRLPAAPLIFAHPPPSRQISHANFTNGKWRTKRLKKSSKFTWEVAEVAVNKSLYKMTSSLGVGEIPLSWEHFSLHVY